MNFKGTKKLYIIKTCEQILYFNSIKHHIQFQYNCRGWGLGVGHYPPKISSDSPRSMLLASPNFDQTVIFTMLSHLVGGRSTGPLSPVGKILTTAFNTAID